MNFNTLLHYDPVQDIADKLKPDPFIGTELEDYCYLSPKSKETISEKITLREIAKLVIKYNIQIEFSSRDDPGHDFKLAKDRIEGKTSVAGMINHLGADKSWTIVVYCQPVDPLNELYSLTYFTKSDFIQLLNLPNRKDFIGRQQGGEKSDNDDWLVKDYKKLPPYFLKPVDANFFKYVLR